MSLKNWIIFMFGFLIFLRSSASETNVGDAEGDSTQSKNEKCVADKDWFVFQRRVNGDVDFDRNWTDYEKEFGNREGDFWLGLEELHELTKEGNMELEINMIRKDTGTHWVVNYSDFRIGPGSDKYKLHVSGYSGNATTNDLDLNNNRQFATKDADHDGCASFYEGAWWHDDGCGNINLNGNFNKTDHKGIWWGDPTYLLRFSEMKFRRRS